MTTIVPLEAVEVGEVTTRGRSPLQRLRETGVVGMISAAILLVAVLAALIGPYITPADPNQPNISLSSPPD